MRYAIFSDVHSNLEALEAVLSDCRQEGLKDFLCIGDIVGYGANPKECIKILQEIKAVCVAGNHDWAVCGRREPVNFNEAAQKAVLWTKGQLNQEEMGFLNHLELVYRNDDLAMVHATLNDPQDFDYLSDMNEAMDTFYLMDRIICFVGHTHISQVLIKDKGRIFYSELIKIKINQLFKYIINVGSVGQSRDGNPQAAYVIFDTEEKIVEIRRVRYDIKTAQKKIIEAGLPEILANRLSMGQ